MRKTLVEEKNENLSLITSLSHGNRAFNALKSANEILEFCTALEV